MGHMGGLINPHPGRGQYRAGFSNTGGSPKPRKRAPCQKKNYSKDTKLDWRPTEVLRATGKFYSGFFLKVGHFFKSLTKKPC